MRHFVAAAGLGLAAACLASAVSAAPAAAPAGDAAAGKAFFGTICITCHVTSGASKPLAPSLKGLPTRKIAGATDFSYTDALKAKTGTWTAASLNNFLKDPQAAVPGTKMPIPIPDDKTRANVIAYLMTLK